MASMPPALAPGTHPTCLAVLACHLATESSARHVSPSPFAGLPGVADTHTALPLRTQRTSFRTGANILFSCSRNMMTWCYGYLPLRPQDCLALLQQLLAVDPALQGSPPFTLPPLTPFTLNSLPDTSCVEPNTVLGPRFGGECVKCGTYGVKEVRR